MNQLDLFSYRRPGRKHDGPQSRRSRAIREAHARGYRVDDEGAIRNPKGKALSPRIDPRRPYPRISYRMASGEHCKIEVHRFVAYQKYGEAALQTGIEARHLDGHPPNVRPDNIAIGTPHDNQMDKSPEVRRAVAMKAAAATRKLTPDQAREIVQLSAHGWSGKRIAAKFGVYKSTVSEILSGKIYFEVTGITQTARPSRPVLQPPSLGQDGGAA